MLKIRLAIASLTLLIGLACVTPETTQTKTIGEELNYTTKNIILFNNIETGDEELCLVERLEGNPYYLYICGMRTYISLTPASLNLKKSFMVTNADSLQEEYWKVNREETLKMR
jgi:hypothetical protein